MPCFERYPQIEMMDPDMAARMNMTAMNSLVRGQTVAGQMVAMPGTPVWSQADVDKAASVFPYPRLIQPVAHSRFQAASGVGLPAPVMVSIVPPWTLPYQVHPMLQAVNTTTSTHAQLQASSLSPPTILVRGPQPVLPDQPTPFAGFASQEARKNQERPSRTSQIRARAGSSSSSSTDASQSEASDVSSGRQAVGGNTTAAGRYAKDTADGRASGDRRVRDNSSHSRCKKHQRMRKTRLRPDSSLLTGKRKYRCETCTAILEQWTETHGARPTETKKLELLSMVGMSAKQLNYWFANRRRTERQAHVPTNDGGSEGGGEPIPEMPELQKDQK